MTRLPIIALAGFAAAASGQVINADINFDVDGMGNQLFAGQGFNGDEYANLGVLISVTDTDAPLNLFDTQNPTGGDPDLETGPAFDTPELGNVLIIQNGSPISVPDDSDEGGTFVFDFIDAAGGNVLSVGILDLDEGVAPIFTATSLADGSEFEVLASNITLVNPAFPDDNSYRIYEFDLAENVGSFSISLPDVSGAITNVEYTTVPTPGALAVIGLAGLTAVRRRR